MNTVFDFVLKVGDVVSAISYVTIAGVLIYFVWKKKIELPATRILLMFGLLLFLNGLTQASELLEQSFYFVEVFLRLATCALSLITAIMLVSVVPKITDLDISNEFKKVSNERQRLEQLAREGKDKSLKITIKTLKEIEQLHGSIKKL